MKLPDWQTREGLSQKELSERIGRHTSTVGRILKREVTPDEDTMKAIFAATNGEVGPLDWFDWAVDTEAEGAR